MPKIPDVEIDDAQLQDNTEQRLACVLVLDGSSSMHGGPIQELNVGLKAFAKALKNDAIASVRVQVGVVRFGGYDEAEILTQFTDAMAWSPPTIQANGNTPLAAGMMTALKMLREQKDAYRRNGISYNRPWLILMTDGEPTDSDSDLRKAEEASIKAIESKGVVVFPIGCGPGADLEALNRFTDVRASGSVSVIKALQFQDSLSWEDFFKWLSVSVASASSTEPGGQGQLAPVAGWAVVNT